MTTSRIRNLFVCAIAVALVSIAAVGLVPKQALALDTVARITVYQTADGGGVEQTFDSFSDLESALDKYQNIDGKTPDSKYPYKIRIDIYADWSSTMYFVPGCNSEIYLHGHMINFNRTSNADANDPVYNNDHSAFECRKDKEMLINGGGGADGLLDYELETEHRGTLHADDTNYLSGSTCKWMYDGAGSDIIKGGLITGFFAYNGGGALFVYGKVTLENVTIAGNISNTSGGAVYMEGSEPSLTLDNAHVLYNLSRGRGGGVYVDSGSTSKASITLKNGSEISNNLCWSHGGGIADECNNSTITLEGASHIDGNFARGNGWKETDDHKITGDGKGGGIYHTGLYGTVTLSGKSTISNNTSLGHGGGVYDEWNYTTFNLLGASEISNNTANSRGGGMYLDDYSTVTLSGGSKISGNTASNGGGIFSCDDGTTITLNEKSEISGNTASGNGGGIDSDDDLNVYGDDTAKITGNTASSGDGGGIWYQNGLYIKGVAITGNTAKNNGGGVYCDNTSFHALALGKTMKITGNTAGNSVNNLYMKEDQDMNGMSDDDALTTDTRIGVTCGGFSGGERKIAGNMAFLTKIGSAYATCVTSDNPRYSVVNKSGYLYLSSKVSRYVISFDTSTDDSEYGEKASKVDPIGVDAGNGYGELPVPTREGYTFAGWYDGDTLVASTMVPTSDKTLVAKWTANRFKVAYVIDGEPYATVERQYGDVVVRPSEPQREGYEFEGWYTDSDCTEEYGFDSPLEDNLMLYGKWVSNAYTVSFDTGEGGTAVDSQQVTYGGAATRPADDPTREGYAFRGWYADADCTVEFNFEGTPIEADTVVHAKWAETLTITLDANGGTVSQESVPTVAGEAVGSLPTPTCEGYAFDGWYDGDTRVTAYTAFSESKTLVAKWRDKSASSYHLVTFMDGDSVIDVKSVKDGKALEEPAAPSKDGFDFVGWYADADCATEFDFNAVISADTTVYAKFAAKEYTVSFDTGKGTPVDQQNIEYGGLPTRPSEDPKRDGYTFEGWYADKDCKVPYDFKRPIEGATTVYVKWAQYVTVTFDAGEGQVAQSETTFPKLTEIGTLPIAYREGYTFRGWYIKSARGYERVGEDTVFSASATVTAHYDATQRLVTFMGEDGMLDAQLVTYGLTVAEPETPFKEGYDFAGWYADEELTQPFDFENTEITADTVVYAKWTVSEVWPVDPDDPDNPDEDNDDSDADNTDSDGDDDQGANGGKSNKDADSSSQSADGVAIAATGDSAGVLGIVAALIAAVAAATVAFAARRRLS